MAALKYYTNSEGATSATNEIRPCTDQTGASGRTLAALRKENISTYNEEVRPVTRRHRRELRIRKRSIDKRIHIPG